MPNSKKENRVRKDRQADPASLGFRMPAEWEPQSAVWFSWPHKRSTWPGRFRPIPSVFASVVAAVSRFERVRINCAAGLRIPAGELCRRAGANLARISIYDHPTDDAWCRDHGPIFVRHRTSGEIALTDWRFNAWGGKYPDFALDNAVPGLVARALRRRRFVRPIVLEGGSIDGNGRGLLLTSEQCLLNPNRNPDLDRGAIERHLRAGLGVRTILWLGRGIAGDDTDGHVDDMARFFKKDGILVCTEPNSRDANHAPLRENRERIDGWRTPGGHRFEVVELPMPKAFGFRGRRVPASYANFLAINQAVLVPTFRQARRDAAACAIIGDCFPGREVIPIDCYDLIWGLGSLHCISQQQPA